MAQSQKFSQVKNIFSNIFANQTIFHRQFLLHNIRKKWPEIMGKLAEHCYPLNVQEGRLVVGVDSAALTNQLYMMQTELLKKVNDSLHGEATLLKLNFVAGSSLKKFSVQEDDRDKEEEKLVNEPKITCPKCGGKMESWRDVCFSCYQEQQREKTANLRKVLLTTPWLKCEEESLEERVFFSRTKENLAEDYYEKVRQQTATEEEKILAVLLYTEKKPVEISQEICQQTLAIISNEDKIKE